MSTSNEERRGETTFRMPKGQSGQAFDQEIRVVVLAGSNRGQAVRLPPVRLGIGKAADNDLVVDDVAVSRYHCELVRDEAGYLLRDLQSTNGTFLDGAQIREAYVEPGAVIGLGGVQLRFETLGSPVRVVPSERDRLFGMVGRSIAMRELYTLIEQVGPTDMRVLILGDTGTGKEVAARALHSLSARRDKPFVVVDCGAVASNLVESELFGHERGAFTGAETQRLGAFERAHTGTLFLDELGELSLDLQPKLLRALEQRQIQRVGGAQPIGVDIRIIAATKRDLLDEVRKGKFRDDLYYRVSGLTLRMPALRERKDDIPLLLQEFAAKAGRTDGCAVSMDVVDNLRRHDWPGNVRELRNVFERGIIFHETLGAAAFNVELSQAKSALAVDSSLPFSEAKERLVQQFEQTYLKAALAAAGGNVSAAARASGLDRKHLHRLLKKYGVA